MNFKLLAIRSLTTKSKRFSKNLIQGKLYNFYNEYNNIMRNSVNRQQKVDIL